MLSKVMHSHCVFISRQQRINCFRKFKRGCCRLL